MDRKKRVSSELYQKMPDLLQYLSPAEQKILTMYYGLDGKEPASYEEIAVLFQVGRERIRKMERKAIRKLEINFL